MRTAPRCTRSRPSLPLEGEWTLAGFCDHLAALELWPEPPEWDVALRLRNWAFESAALDLALGQAGRPLHEMLGLERQPVRFGAVGAVAEAHQALPGRPNES